MNIRISFPFAAYPFRAAMYCVTTVANARCLLARLCLLCAVKPALPLCCAHCRYGTIGCTLETKSVFTRTQLFTLAAPFIHVDCYFHARLQMVAGLIACNVS